MKKYFSIPVLFILFTACQKPVADQSNLKDSATVAGAAKNDNLDLNDSAGDLLDSADIQSESAIFYLITLAEGKNYDSLETFAKKAASSLNLKYDQLGRIYKPEKGIVVKDDDEDEMYRGEYYPRRFEGNFVSIEMKKAFIDKENDPMRMLVISNIFSKPSQADSMLKIARVKFPSVKSVQTILFTGCMH
jgi:hypothetical protein